MSLLFLFLFCEFSMKLRMWKILRRKIYYVSVPIFPIDWLFVTNDQYPFVCGTTLPSLRKFWLSSPIMFVHYLFILGWWTEKLLPKHIPSPFSAQHIYSTPRYIWQNVSQLFCSAHFSSFLQSPVGNSF